MSNKFKADDYVKIREDSEYYGDGESNPPNMIGVICIIRQSFLKYYVIWQNGHANTYDDIDLEHAFYDTKLNRVLYPELKPKDGFLVREEN
jgi:hypothetical protein